MFQGLIPSPSVVTEVLSVKECVHPLVQIIRVSVARIGGKGGDGYPPLLGDGGGKRKRRDVCQCISVSVHTVSACHGSHAQAQK
jgi:hypothetical protein